MTVINIYETEQVCANCVHYYYHYGKRESRIFKINAGHCVYPRIKDRKPGYKACINFQEKELN